MQRVCTIDGCACVSACAHALLRAIASRCTPWRCVAASRRGLQFSERMIPALVAAGIEWVIVPNNHLSRACAGYPYSPSGDNNDVRVDADPRLLGRARHTARSLLCLCGRGWQSCSRLAWCGWRGWR